MKRALLIALFACVFDSLAAQAQDCSSSPVSNVQASAAAWQTYATWCSRCGGIPNVSNYSCTPTSNWGGGSGGGSSSPVNSALYNGFYQLGYNFGRWLFGSGGSNSADDALREQQQQLMMAEVRRRAEEAERLHQEEEARRLTEMYNRLARTLKMSGLPHLQLKTSGIPVGGLHLKLGDSADGHVGINGLPGIYLNDGATPYGIPGLPGIYTGGPGPGSALQPPTQLGSRLKTGDGAAASPATTAGAFDQGTVDFNKASPQQLADAADSFSKLPPEEQQRLMAGTPNPPVPTQQAPPPSAKGWTTTQANDTPASTPAAEAAPAAATTPQTAALPIAALQQQANASQAAAAAPTLEDASAKARAGFDTPLGPAPVTASQTVAPRVPTQSGPAAPPVQSRFPASARVNPPLPSGLAMAATAAPGTLVEPPAFTPIHAPMPVAPLISQLTDQQLHMETCHVRAMLFTMKGDFEADSRHLQDWYEESDKAQREALETSYNCLNDMIKEELGGWLTKRLMKIDWQKWGTETTLAFVQCKQDLEEADEEYDKSAHTREDGIKHTKAILQAFYALTAGKARGFDLTEHGADITGFVQCSTDYATAAMEWNLARDEINQTNDNLNGKLKAQQVLSNFYRQLVDESLHRGLDPASCH